MRTSIDEACSVTIQMGVFQKPRNDGFFAKTSDMRIIGGEARGRKISPPAGKDVRPTPEMIREALFNILSSLEEVDFLDLFAGTGSVGLEALSRGARTAMFVEKNGRMASRITDLLENWNYAARAKVLPLDIKIGTAKLSKDGRKFNRVFADPPYEKGMISKTIQYCLESGILSDDGLMILQHSTREPLELPSQYHPLELIQERRYGDTIVSFLQFHPLRSTA